MKHLGSSFFTTVAIILLCSCAVSPVQIAETKTTQRIPAGATPKPVQLEKMLTKIPLGEQIGQFQYGWWCAPGAVVNWRGGRLNITDEELIDTFKKELENSNYSVVGDPYAIFGDPESKSAEILVGGLFEKLDIKVCYPFSGSPNIDIGNTRVLKGGVFMRVAWQIYNRVEGKVVYEVSTEGSYKTEETTPGGLTLFLRNAFAANIRNLLADPQFHSLVLAK